ncbi:MAG: D-alanyl-D-alanine carboxypeptidase [Clostridia bacterium]|nr:D-alanyl-D-alanine carboxypeptidase [Clostridia bacterium]
MKKRFFIRAICLLFLCASLILCSLVSVSSSSYSEGLPDVSRAKNVYFANLETGKVLLKKNPDGAIAPASTVKIMTGLLALEHFEGKLDTPVTITAAMLSASEGTSMRLAEGDVISAEELIYGVVCGGCNDAAYALAYAVSGSVSDFVALMNQRAYSLGAENTRYTNPTGWDDAKMVTTLTDTVRIAKEALDNERYMEISSAVSRNVSFISDKEDYTLNNRNALISSYYAQGYTNKYADGMIAGMTDNGGYCVVTRATIGDASYLCVVMGANEKGDTINSFAIANDLIAYAAYNLGFVPIMKKGEYICDIPVDFALTQTKKGESSEPEVSAVTGADARVYIPLSADTENEISYKYYLYSDRLSAPLTEGTRVGGVDFYYNGEIVDTVPLVLHKSVDVNSFTLKIDEIKNFITGRTVIISLLCFLILFFIWFYFFDYKKRRRTAKKIRYKNH